jgi:seryl-tRNA synthetase
MFDIKWIRENAAEFDAGRRRRGLSPMADELVRLDDARRAAIAKLQAAQERRNAASKEIGRAMAGKDAARADALKAEVNRLKSDLAAFESEERTAVAALDRTSAAMSNVADTARSRAFPTASRRRSISSWASSFA